MSLVPKFHQGSDKVSSSSTPKPNGPELGTMLRNRYRLDLVIGTGGSSTVYQATDTMLDIRVAVKVLFTDDAIALQLGLKNEAIAAIRLHHANIVRLYNYEEDHHWVFLVMELLEGKDCNGLRKQHPTLKLPIDTLFHVMSGAFDALDYAHSMGVAHHDVKPSNIFVCQDGVIKMCDFGIASTSTQRDHPGGISLGTPAFMPPERIRGERGDTRSDIYSLGATLYTLMVGQTPFGADVPAVFDRHLTKPVPNREELGGGVYEVISRAMAKLPKERYQTIGHFRKELKQVLANSVPLSDSQYRTDHMPVVTAPPAASDDIIEIDSGSVLVPSAVPDGMVELPSFELKSAYKGFSKVVPAFRIDAFPVTNQEYAEFVQATDELPPDSWPGKRPDPLLSHHPVVGVTHEQARRFAKWKGKRLPTSLEWQAAARAPDNRRFPWGDTFIPEIVRGPHSGSPGTAALHQGTENVSAYGVAELVGNIWEWTDVDLDDEAPDTGYTWVFGGSFKHDCQPNGGIARTSVNTNNSYAYLGFRCASDKS